MPWDMFCNKCCNTLVGDMIDGTDEEIEKSMDEYRGSIVYCNHCNTYTDFNSGDTIDLVSHLYYLFNEAPHPRVKDAIGFGEVRIINGG